MLKAGDPKSYLFADVLQETLFTSGPFSGLERPQKAKITWPGSKEIPYQSMMFLFLRWPGFFRNTLGVQQ